VYRQVADDLRNQIRCGGLRPGERLPGEERLAAGYGVGLNSIRAALQLLRAERLVVTEHGVGTRVREPQERTTVNIPNGARWYVRPATEQERRRLGLAEHEPVVVVETDGHERVWAAYRHVFESEASSTVLE
jgi:GntR family transcriptional regulator